MKPLPLLLFAAGLALGCGRLSRGSKIPATSPPVVLAPGVRFQEVRVSKFPEHPRLWIYTPGDKKKNHPCVLIAAAGSDLVSGMDLGEGDRAEHLPYVKAGYVVVAYDVSGALPAGGSAEAEGAARRLFAKRELGIANGKAAADYALRHLPIDPMRLYAVGHSSAATLALQFAAADSRVRGCVAYAPVPDVATHSAPVLATVSPDLAHQVRALSPALNLESLRCPVMIFSAEDDATSPFAEVQFYAAALTKHNGDVTFIRAASGGHYDSMISQGIPEGIRWMGRARRPKK
jgi:dienelactone hydrolase